MPVGELDLKDEVHVVGKGIGRNLRRSLQVRKRKFTSLQTQHSVDHALEANLGYLLRPCLQKN